MPKKAATSTTKQKVEPLVPQRKRGRKPKGGKIITITEGDNKPNTYSSNVIVHLKCKKTDLGFNEDEISTLSNNSGVTSYEDNNTEQFHVIEEKKIDNKKNINEKLKDLQAKLHNNVVNETDSACFWCTYNFSNLPVSIPKFEINGTYHVYGCFCSPECATAYLMNENIDSSIKFERYHLLCYIYSKIYEYKSNIKPAPDPHYTLKKYFGNLTIDEYRELFASEKRLFMIDKPITRELPELHEEYSHSNRKSFASTAPKTSHGFSFETYKQ
jgi:hypothetical protein